ncbi:hypothetical protein OZX73_02045 [Bifidobacterium sp. ESL0775]|uniref:hypothetical protein n=1 Tax=Bifidobacterium sp. ESL0775 TaxID=2983230 RepID=UPI0023F86338|nr:hypothetical protein [Bifidobacterium sp. ESL0775]WEV70153.1 hypothetical protein OZX73_02045 [Bifidobacterium sp. ESL0775]
MERAGTLRDSETMPTTVTATPEKVLGLTGKNGKFEGFCVVIMYGIAHIARVLLSFSSSGAKLGSGILHVK